MPASRFRPTSTGTSGWVRLPARTAWAVCAVCTIWAALLWLSAGQALAADTPSSESSPRTVVSPPAGWVPYIVGHSHVPERFVAVDKAGQQLILFEHSSPLAATRVFPCTTGQVVGDKQKRGDMRTPEGVYFVRRTLTGGLDFDLYGDRAFVLNYPNPVDRLKGKTGSGIWIHGRGHEISPRETKGCVALNNPDIAELDKDIGPGTPVLVGSELTWAKQAGDVDDPMAEKVARAVNDWAGAWQARSDRFLEYYDSKAFSRTRSRSFRAFANRKKRLFRAHPWIQVMIHDLRILPGPDYWVASFGQYYRTRSMTSQGEKRLYWQLDDQGELRIVGREWREANLGLDKYYLEQVEGQARDVLESWRADWEAGNLNAYLAHYAEDCRQGRRRGRDAVAEQKAALWRSAPPAKVALDDIHVSLDTQGVAITFAQRYQSADGSGDLGRKTLVLEPEGDGTGWRIVNEQWRAM